MMHYDDAGCIWVVAEFASKAFELLLRDQPLLVEPGPHRRESDDAKPVRVMSGLELGPHVGERLERAGEAAGWKSRNVVVARYGNDGNIK